MPASAETGSTVTNNKPNKKRQLVATPTHHLVKVGDTLYAIGLNSGHSYQKLALWNHIVPPYPIMVGQSLKLFPPVTKTQPSDNHHNITVTKGNDNTHLPAFTTAAKSTQSVPPIIKKTPTSQEEKSVISIGNKRMLKLNFKWPIKGKVLKNFSQSNLQGIEIANGTGKQPVFAAENGKIVYTGQQLDGFKNLIIIKHSHGYLSAYANTSRLLAKEGQQVEKSQVIAEISLVKHQKNTLHFEIRKNGNPVDPLNLLPK